MKQNQEETTPKTTTEIPQQRVSSVESEDKPNPLPSRLATIAAVGLGVALIEVELIPGMLIGAAAVLAPNFLPKLGNALKPILKTTVRGGYAFANKAMEMIAEAGEHVEDIVAEAKAEAERDTAASRTARKQA